jgi:PKD repeat protein
MAFFKTDSTAASWFLKPTPSGQAPTVTASASVTSGAPGLTVQFNASATDPNPGATITQYAWTYDDGDFSFNQNPTKTFDVAGTYNVHLTVTDSLGFTAQSEITITIAGSVQPPSAPPPPSPTPAPPPSGSIADDDKLFLGQLFESLLGRSPTDAESANWLGQLENNVLTRSQVALDLIASQEYQTDLVNVLYPAILHRTADTAGLNAWVTFLSQGGTQEQVQADLLGSGEFFTNIGSGTDSGLAAAPTAAL